MKEQGFIERQTQALTLRKNFIAKAVRRDWWITVTFIAVTFVAESALLAWLVPNLDHHKAVGPVNLWGVGILLSFLVGFGAVEWGLSRLKEKRELAEKQFENAFPDVAKLFE